MSQPAPSPTPSPTPVKDQNEPAPAPSAPVETNHEAKAEEKTLVSLADPLVDVILGSQDGKPHVLLVSKEGAPRKVAKGTVLKTWKEGSLSKGPKVPEDAILFKPAATDLVVLQEDSTSKVFSVKDFPLAHH